MGQICRPVYRLIAFFCVSPFDSPNLSSGGSPDVRDWVRGSGRGPETMFVLSSRCWELKKQIHTCSKKPGQ
ncbi:hypothetical protein VTO42DRAFT_7388 [Malbranchea cinnamomea]